MMKIPDTSKELIQFVGGRQKFKELFNGAIKRKKGKLTPKSRRMIEDAILSKKFEPQEIVRDWEDEEEKSFNPNYCKHDPSMFRVPVTKTEAIEMFNGKSSFCRAVGISLQSLAFWNEDLTKNARARVELAMIKKRQQMEEEHNRFEQFKLKQLENEKKD